MLKMSLLGFLALISLPAIAQDSMPSTDVGGMTVQPLPPSSPPIQPTLSGGLIQPNLPGATQQPGSTTPINPHQANPAPSPGVVLTIPTD